MRIATTLIAAALMAGCAAASARVETLVKTCLEQRHKGSELQDIAIETTELPGAEWQAGLRVEYKQRRSADRDWDVWVAPMAATIVAGKMAVSNGPAPFDPAKQCATE